MTTGKVILISAFTSLGMFALVGIGYILIAKFGDFSKHQPAIVHGGEAPISGQIVSDQTKK
jgi:hypothetical protein